MVRASGQGFLPGNWNGTDGLANNPYVRTGHFYIMSLGTFTYILACHTYCKLGRAGCKILFFMKEPSGES